MFLRSIGLTAGFALAADCFMIPSTISLPELHNKVSGWPSLDVTRLADSGSRSRIVKLNCADCAFPVIGKEDVWTTDIPNSLVFGFSVSDGGKAVILNGERIYPLDHAVQLKAPQVASDVADKLLYTSLDEFTTTPRQLDFALGSRTVEAADGTDAQLIDIDLRVFGIDGASTDLGALCIRLLRDEDGKVTIADIDTIPARGGPRPDKTTSDKDEFVQILPINHKNHKSNPVCNSPAAFLCHWVEVVESKVGAMRNRLSHHGNPSRRPCPGKAGKHGISTKGGVPKFMAWKYGPKRPHMHGGLDVDSTDLHDTMMHHGADGHGPYHHRHHGGPRPALRRLVRGLKHFIVGFVIPILIGVAAGMTASLLGMMVGTFIAWAWIKFVRGGRRHSQPQMSHLDDDDITRGERSEKASLLDESSIEEACSAPPVYVEKE